MCNGTWACFDCRLAVRRRAWRLVTYLNPALIGSDFGDVRCAGCGQPCLFLGPTTEIPPKDDARAWDALRERIWQARAAAADEEFRRSVRRRHILEQLMRDMQRRPRNPERDHLIKSLREMLTSCHSPGPESDRP